MSNQKRRHYEASFKAKLLKMHAHGRSVKSLSESFGINENVIYRWRKKAQQEVSQEATSDIVSEVLELRKRLREVEEERDILKKALGIFSRPA